MYFISQFMSWQQNSQASSHICVDAKYVNGLYTSPGRKGMEVSAE